MNEGYFNPISKGKEVRLEINKERVDYWIDQGAQLSGRVESLIKEFNETDEEKQKREQPLPGGKSKRESSLNKKLKTSKKFSVRNCWQCLPVISTSG